MIDVNHVVVDGAVWYGYDALLRPLTLSLYPQKMGHRLVLRVYLGVF